MEITSLHESGMDLTEEMNEAPHGEEKFESIPIVGEHMKNYGGSTGLDYILNKFLRY